MATPAGKARAEDPIERVFRDEEAEAVPAESVHLERKATGYLKNHIKKGCRKRSVLLTFWTVLR